MKSQIRINVESHSVELWIDDRLVWSMDNLASIEQACTLALKTRSEKAQPVVPG